MLKYFMVLVALVAIILISALIERQSYTPALRVAPRQGPVTIFAPGRVEGVGEEILLRTQLTGRIARIAVAQGQHVQAGDLLLQLDDEQYQHEAALAEAELKQYEAAIFRLVNGASKEEREEAQANYRASVADLEREELSWRRIQQLRDDRAISQLEADNQRMMVSALLARRDAAKAQVDAVEAPARDDELEMARAKVAAAQAKRDLAQVQLARTRLVAPVAGTILHLNVRLGELTGPDVVDPPIVMADTSKFRVRAYVEELDARRVQIGMTAEVAADGEPVRTWPGHVSALSPRMGRKRLFTDDPAEHFDVKIREVWIDLDTPDALLVGLRVDVAIDPATTGSTPVER